MPLENSHFHILPKLAELLARAGGTEEELRVWLSTLACVRLKQLCVSVTCNDSLPSILGTLHLSLHHAGNLEGDEHKEAVQKPSMSSEVPAKRLPGVDSGEAG